VEKLEVQDCPYAGLCKPYTAGTAESAVAKVRRDYFEEYWPKNIQCGYLYLSTPFAEVQLEKKRKQNHRVAEAVRRPFIGGLTLILLKV
jgi:hypothetical protein